MANTGSIQVPSNLSNLKTFPDLVRFLSAWASQVTQQFNGLIATKTVWGTIGASGTIGSGSGNFGVSLSATGLYHIAFREAFSSKPAIVPMIETAVIGSFHVYPSGVTTTGFNVNVNSNGTPVNNAFSFIAMGGK